MTPLASRAMRSFLSIVLFAALVLLAVPAEAARGVPTAVSYQGTLADTGGNPLGGTGTQYYFKFSFWDSATVGQGSRVWPASAPTAVQLLVRQGSFNVDIGGLGYPDALDYDFSANSSAYLQIEVSPDGSSFETLSPRSAVTSSPFAQVASRISGLGQSTFGTTSPFASSILTSESTSSSAVALTLFGAAGQTANLFDIFAFDGSSLFSVGADGRAASVGFNAVSSNSWIGYTDGNNYLRGRNYFGLNDTSVLDSNTGNVGIGTLFPNYPLSLSSAGSTIGIADTSDYDAVGGALTITGGASSGGSSAGGNLVLKGGNSNTGEADVAGDVKIYGGINNYPSTIFGGAVRVFTSDAERLTVLNDGNVGIGAIAPETKLDVVGDIVARNISSESPSFQTRVNGYGQPFTFGGVLSGDLTGRIVGNSGAGLVVQGFSKSATAPAYRMQGHIGSASPTQFPFMMEAFKSDGGSSRASLEASEKAFAFYNGAYDAGGTVIMSMLGNGNVGIGATMPTSKLAIKGSGVGTGKAFSVLDSLDQEKFTILDNGSVGVGVTNPDALGALAIGGQTTTVVNISTTGTLGAGGRAILQMTNADGSAGYDFGVTSPVSPNFSIRDVAAVSIPRFTIDSVGNIGVSTTTPGARLSVRGGGTTTGQAFQITDSANTPKFTVLDNGAVTALNGITVNNARAQLNSGIGIAGGSDVGSSGSIWTNTSGPLFDTVLAGFNLSFYTGNNSSRVQRMILSTAGDLGLGTSTPAARLSIQSSFGSTTALFDVATTTSAAFATSSLFRINANGTIGVGTSTMANSVFTTLDGSASGKAIGLQLASSNSNTAQGQLRISSSPTSYTDFFQGTVSGNDSLNINVVGVTNNRLNLIFSNNATSYFDTNGWNIVNSGTALPQILLNRTSNYIQFRNGFNAPRVTLGTNGAVNGPGMLELYGVDDIKTVSINATSTSYLNTGANFGIGSTTPGARLSVKGSGTTTGQAFQITDSANAPKLTVLDNGNVGIGTTNPQAALSLSSGKAISVFNTADEVTNTESGRIEWVSNELRIGTSRAGTGSSRSLRLLALNDTSQIVMGNNPFVDFQQNANTTAAAGVFRFAQTGTNSMSAASGNQSFLNLQSRYNQTGTAAGTDLLIQRTEVAVGSGAQHLIQAGTSTNTSMFVVTNRGNIGLGTSTPTAQLSTTGTVRFAALTGAGSNLIVDALGNVTVSSDERLKDVSGQFTRGLADVRKLSPITYHWKAETGYDTASAYTGFSAQNVQSAIPEAVATSANGYLNLADRPIIAAVVNAVKELDLKISSLTDGTAELVVRRIKASELCLDDVCITKDQLRDLLNRNGVSASVSEPAAPAASQPVTESTPSAPVIETPVATTTPDVVATSTPEAIPEPVAVTEATSTTPVIEPTPEPVAPEPASEPVAPTEAPAPEL